MNMIVDTDFKRYVYIIASFLMIFAIGFSITTGLISASLDVIKNSLIAKIGYCVIYHTTTLEREARHYFLLPQGAYSVDIHLKPLSAYLAAAASLNALFNSLFQPLFLCIFTPQALLNLLLFPFFLYGAIKYFKRVPVMILVFFIVYIYVGLYGSVIEALIRHRMSCELIYLLIGIAGFTGLITENLS